MAFTTIRSRTLAVASAAGLVAALTAGLSAANGATSHGGDRGEHVRLDRVFIIVLENHSQKSVIGDPNTPYISSLAQQYGEAASYFGVTHPSEPNYIAMTSGSNWFTNNDNPANRFDHTNIVDELEAHHISWGAYMDAMPSGGQLADFWPSSADPLYASKHNPFPLYSDVRDNPARLANVKPYTDLAGDLNTGHAPRYVYIVPDQCNDMHGGVFDAIAGHPETPCPFNSTNDDPADVLLKHNADAFVRGAVTTIRSSKAWTRHSAIFIVADEGDFTGNAANGGWDSPAGCCDSPVLPKGDPDISATWPGGLYSDVAYNHYSMLRTIEDDWGLPELGFTSDHAQVSNMNEFLAR